jgi:hypothetical protein
VGQGLHTVAAQEPGTLPGTVIGEQKLASSTGGFTGALDNADRFGHALAAIGDLDGDGLGELAVGAPEDDDGGVNRGALWVLFLERAGTARAQAKISSSEGGFPGAIDNTDRFGCAVAGLGGLDGDGTREIAVGAEQDDDGGLNRGAVWILSLDAAGQVAAARKVSQASGGFTGLLRDGDLFGHALAALGDLDGDGVGELAVGANLDDEGGSGRGAVWVLFLDAQGAVVRQTKVAATSGGFTGPLHDGDRFGSSLARLGDLDGDGTPELAVGAQQDDDGGLNRGAVWILFLRPDGTVRAETKLSAPSGLAIDDSDHFGSSLASPGDVNGDGTGDLAVGALLDDDGGPNRGAVWLLFLASDGTLAGSRKISSLAGGLTGPLASNSFFGSALAALGDLDGDRMLDLAVGAVGDDTGGVDRGASWVLFLESAELSVLVVRNGLGVNPLLLSADEAPAVGSTWEVDVDCRGFNNGVVIHQVTDQPLDGPLQGRLGQRLIDWSRPCFLRVVVRHSGAETVLCHRVPADAGLVGLPFYSQAHVTGRGGARLTNALDGEFLLSELR